MTNTSAVDTVFLDARRGVEQTFDKTVNLKQLRGEFRLGDDDIDMYAREIVHSLDIMTMQESLDILADEFRRQFNLTK